MIKKQNKNKSIYRLLGIVFVVAFSFMFIKGALNQPQITKNEAEIAELKEKIEYEKKRTEEVEELKTKVDTDEYIEKVAREKLGMIKRDEIVFIDISG